MLFTPNYEDPIPQHNTTRDLGILIDDDCSFSSQRKAAITKTNQRCGWVLRTFQTRDPHLLRFLWRTLCQPIQDYGSQLWSPVGDRRDLQAQEGPLRNFLRHFGNFKDENYWQRLRLTKLSSCERRNQRYRIIYVWKSLAGFVPSLGLHTRTDRRFGVLIDIPKLTGNVCRIVTLKEKMIHTAGSKLFNCLPRTIREFVGNPLEFKAILDQYLSLIPDCPILPGYTSHNLDAENRQSNCIIMWTKNLEL